MDDKPDNDTTSESELRVMHLIITECQKQKKFPADISYWKNDLGVDILKSEHEIFNGLILGHLPGNPSRRKSSSFPTWKENI